MTPASAVTGRFELTHESIRAGRKDQLRDAGAGAYAEFEGWVRETHEGRAVRELFYEAHEALAVHEGERILDEAHERFAIRGVRAVHRLGRLEPGEVAVWIGVAAAHRGAAFDACRYVIDEIKTRVPIWKKEIMIDGAAHWVDAAGAGGGVGEPSP